MYIFPVSFYKKKDATYVFHYIRTPPCQFSLSDEFVLPRKWWRGRGVPHPIWDFQRGGCPIQFGISIYGGSYCIENTFCYFYMSDGCVMVKKQWSFSV
jgi:hypothetical protein